MTTVNAVELCTTQQQQQQQQSQTRALCASLYQFFVTEQLCDITLSSGIDKQNIACHRLVLCASSPYFRALLAGPLYESHRTTITIESIGGGTLAAVIAYCYTGHIQLNDDNVDDVVAAATLLQCHRIEDLCTDYLLTTLGTGNALGLWQLAQQYELVRLKQPALQLVLDDFDDVIVTHEFDQLRPEALRMLLAHDALCVWSEEQVFEAMVRWVLGDEGRRSLHCGRLLEVVRMAQLKRTFLFDRVSFYCERWRISFDDVRQLQCNVSLPRAAAIHPVLLSVGGNGMEDDTVDGLLIKRYNYRKHRWQTVHTLPGYRFGHSALPVGDYLYVFGGQSVRMWDADAAFLATAQRVHLQTGQVEVLPSMLAPRHFYANAVHIDGGIYVMGGDMTNGVALERYEIATRVWTSLQQWAIGGDDAQLRGTKLTSTVDNIYASGGFGSVRQASNTADDFIDRVAVYSLTHNTWTEMPPMQKERMHHLPFVYDEQLYVIGGDVHFTNRHSMERFDAETGTWQFVDISATKVPTYVNAVTVHQRRLYICGYDEFSRNTLVFGYLDMVTMRWTKLSASDRPIDDHGKLVFVPPYDPMT